MIRISRRLPIAFGLALALGSTTQADPPSEGPARLVHDFFPGELEGVWTQPQFTQLGDVLFFVAEELDTGEGVWRTDGTPAGTRRIPVPGESGIGGGSRILGTLGPRVLWSQNGDGVRTRTLLSASRRGRGTLLATFQPQYGLEPLAFAGGRFFFQDCTDAACPIWSTDGTVPGTAPVRTLADRFPAAVQEIFTSFANRWLVFRSNEKIYAYDVPQDRVLPLLPKGAQGLWVSEIYPVGENLFFVTVDNRSSRNRLWVSRLSAPRASQIFSDNSLSIAGWRDNRLYFIPENRRLWSTAGTRESTRPYPGAQIANYSAFADRLGTLGPITLLPALGYHSIGLFRADETRNKLRKLYDPCRGEEDCLLMGISPVAVAGHQGYLTIGRSLWQSDGSPKGTKPHDVLGPADAGTFHTVGDRLLLGAARLDGEEQLWETDGTAAGTRALSDAGLGAFRVQGPPILFAGAIFASAVRKETGQQIWRLDGDREAQVTRLRHLARGLYPILAIPVGDRLVTRAHGYESLGWYGLAEDGSAEKLPVYEDDCSPSFENPCPRTRVLLGRRLLFIPLGEAAPLQSTDGTAAGTVTLVPSAVALGRFGDRALALDREGGLWTSDGTAGGTHRFAKVPSGSDPDWKQQPVGPPVASGSQAFLFRQVPLDAGLAALELWRTDGTETGTFRLASLSFDKELTPLPSPALAGGRLFFRFQGTLWRSDGSVQGTEPLPTLLPEPTLALAAGPATLQAVTGQPGEKRQTLWAIDPETLQKTRLGTFDRIADESAGLTLDSVQGNAFLFRATQDNVERWWRTEGTPESTHPLPEPLGEANRAVPFFAARDRLYFLAPDSEHGWELWSSGQSGENARLVQDFWPGPQTGFPEILAVTGDAIWLAATHPDVGRELWKIDLSQGNP